MIYTDSDNSTIFLVDGLHGQYVPQRLAQLHSLTTAWRNVNPIDWQVLESGPDHPDYWDCWERILTDARVILKDAQGIDKTYYLHSTVDGVWLVDINAEIDWEF